MKSSSKNYVTILKNKLLEILIKLWWFLTHKKKFLAKSSNKSDSYLAVQTKYTKFSVNFQENLKTLKNRLSTKKKSRISINIWSINGAEYQVFGRVKKKTDIQTIDSSVKKKISTLKTYSSGEKFELQKLWRS